MDVLTTIKDTLIAGRHEEVAELVKGALEDGADAKTLLDDGLLPGMDVIGARFRAYEIFLPDVLLAARAMYAGLDLLQPLLEGDARKGRGTVVIGSVEGDLHDIGKNLVGIMLRGAGYQVIDLGNSVSPQAFVAAAHEHAADVVGMSALLTTTMPVMARVVEALREAGLGDTKTIVGGAAVSEKFAAEIGATAYAWDAARAVELLNGWYA